MKLLEVLGFVEDGDDKRDSGRLGGFHCGQYITKKKRRQQRDSLAEELELEGFQPVQCRDSTASMPIEKPWGVKL